MNIVMALDRSRHARAAIQLLQQLRWPAGSTLTLLHMLEVVTISGGWQPHDGSEPCDYRQRRSPFCTLLGRRRIVPPSY